VTSPLYYWGGMQNGATTYENLAYNNYNNKPSGANVRLAKRRLVFKRYELHLYNEHSFGYKLNGLRLFAILFYKVFNERGTRK
jgi:hypothetical protein